MKIKTLLQSLLAVASLVQVEANAMEGLRTANQANFVGDPKTRTQEEWNRLNREAQLNNYCVYLASQYFDSENDFSNLEIGCPRFLGNTSKFFYNPIPLDQTTREWFDHLKTLNIYHNNDNRFINDQRIEKRVDIYRKYKDAHAHVVNNNIRHIRNQGYTSQQRLMYDSKDLEEHFLHGASRKFTEDGMDMHYYRRNIYNYDEIIFTDDAFRPGKWATKLNSPYRLKIMCMAPAKLMGETLKNMNLDVLELHNTAKIRRHNGIFEDISIEDLLEMNPESSFCIYLADAKSLYDSLTARFGTVMNYIKYTYLGSDVTISVYDRTLYGSNNPYPDFYKYFAKIFNTPANENKGNRRLDISITLTEGLSGPRILTSDELESSNERLGLQ